MIPKDISALGNLNVLDEGRMERNVVRKTVDNEIRPGSMDLDEIEGLSWDQIRTLAKSELMGILVPEPYGRQQGSHLLYVMVVEEIIRACAATVLVCFTNMHGQLPILLARSEEQKLAYLPPAARGDWLGAIAVTDIQHESDVAHMGTRVERVSGGYVLNGEKVFITSGDKAEVSDVQKLVIAGQVLGAVNEPKDRGSR